MITLSNVSKEFREGIRGKRVKAIEDLSLEVGTGEVFGFLGPNGAGKSTTIKVLMNLIYPDRGSAMIAGRDVRETEGRRYVGYLPENPYFYDYLTAEELLWFGGTISASYVTPRRTTRNGSQPSNPPARASTWRCISFTTTTPAGASATFWPPRPARA